MDTCAFALAVALGDALPDAPHLPQLGHGRVFHPPTSPDSVPEGADTLATCTLQRQRAVPSKAMDSSSQSALIEATSQVSRFHAETLEVTSNKSLQLQQVNLSVNCKPLLSDAVLSLQAGIRYGLIGRNGVGKSTLLHVLGTRTLVGFPKWLTCLHVQQEVAGSDSTTAVDAVIAADATAVRLQRNVDLLESAMDSGSDTQLIDAVAALQTEHAADDATAAFAIAAARSGKRGMIARKAAVAADQTAVETAATAAVKLSAEAAAAAAHEMITQLYQQLAELDVDAAEGKARQILTGLGLSKELMECPTGQLSGGWRMRVALACALFAEPDILCLDEPTNHLDLEATLWLQEYLSNCCEDQTLLMVSHDRSFLNAVCQETIELKDKQLRYFPGPYDAYMEAKAAAALASSRQAAALDKQRKHIEASIQAAEKQARQAGDDKKLSQAASRKKKLEERHGLDKNAAGHRFKLNRDMVGYFDSRRPQVVLEAADKPFEFKWPQPEGLRAAGPLLQLRGVSYTYPGAPAPVLHDVTMDITLQSRIALLGHNGAGKSTLMKLLSGQLAPTPPPPGFTPPAAQGTDTSCKTPTKKQLKAARFVAVDASTLPSARAAAAAVAAGGASAAGSVERAAAMKVGLFGQHCIEELQVDETALERLTRLYSSMFTREQESRDYLGSFGLGGGPSVQPLRSLSGGQKARAALAFLLANKPQLLLLDEPTNHLDLDTVEALVRAIDSYEGAVVVASHDVRFVQEVVGKAGEGSEEGQEAGLVYVVGGGAVKRWDRDGGVAAYAQWLLGQVMKKQGGKLQKRV